MVFDSGFVDPSLRRSSSYGLLPPYMSEPKPNMTPLGGIQQLKGDRGSLTILLYGPVGSGKSSFINVILGRNGFITKAAPDNYSKATKCSVTLIDTPSLFDASCFEETIRERSKSNNGGEYSQFAVGKKGAVEYKVQNIKTVFGERAEKHIMRKYVEMEIEEIKQMIEKQKQDKKQMEKILRETFENLKKNQPQVKEPLQKIDNGGSYDTNEMFQKAEEAIKERLLKEMEEEIRREKEKMRKYVEEMEEMLQTIEKQEEKKTIEKMLRETVEKLKKDQPQVKELLQKIDNGGSYHTNEMFQRAEEAIQKEKEEEMERNNSK